MRFSYAVAALALAAAVPAAAGDVGESLRFESHGLSSLAPQSSADGKSVVFHSGPSAAPREAWDTLLIHGELTEGVALEASRGDGAWRKLEVHAEADGRFWAKAVFSNAAAPVQIRGVAAPGATIKDEPVTLYGVEVFSSAQGEEDKAATEPDRGGRRRPRPSPAPRRPAREPRQTRREPMRPPIHLRAEWNARAPKEETEDAAIWRLTLHHTEGRYSDTLADSLREVKGIQDFHMNGRGWSDIAYHFLIDGAGNIIEGRPEGIKGAHAGNGELNAGNVGICMLGSYHPPRNDQPTADQLESFAALGRYLKQKYDIDPKNLKGHRDWKSTDCPGNILYARLPMLRQAIGFVFEAIAALNPIRLPEGLLRFVDWNGLRR
ncbi:MAG: N-acetylmuramoyl-L-alanine amidase [Proteobacteria bacterium]|nr:N-acetylmuramoyl-L-alanine amidase [Pseudomonadota bacterium]